MKGLVGKQAQRRKDLKEHRKSKESTVEDDAPTAMDKKKVVRNRRKVVEYTLVWCGVTDIEDSEDE